MVHGGCASVGCFAMTDAVRDWMISGRQSVWALLSPRVVSGNVPNVPNWLYTGNNGDLSFILAGSIHVWRRGRGNRS